MTKSEKKLFDKLSQLGCIVCLREGYGFSPTEIHHIRQNAGMGQKSKEVIPLCPQHHRIGGYGIAIHAGQKEFESKYGTEKFLLECTNQLLKENP